MHGKPKWLVGLHGVILSVIAVGVFSCKALQRSSEESPRPPTPAMAIYRGGVEYYDIDTGYLENTDTEPRRLFDITLSASDERGTPEILVLTGTELGSGSFIRLRDPKRPEWHKDFHRLWEGRVLFFQVHGNSVIVELWGAPGSRNRLRIVALYWVDYSSPIEPDVAPDGSRPA